MKMKWIGAILLLTQIAPLGSHLSASQRVGNGGFLAICRDGQDVTYNLLDYLDGEFRFAQFGKVDLGPPTDHVEHVRFVFERLAKFDPIRSAEYLAELDKFFEPNNLRFLAATYPLPVAADIGVDMIPSNCETKQIAANTIPFQPEEPKFWIKEELWDKLDEVNKAGLIIHEIVYNDALIRGHETSEYARYYTFLISSEKFADLSQAVYDQKLLDIYLGEVSSIYKRIDVHTRTRFFTSRNFTFEEAKKFCADLPGRSWMLGSIHLNNEMLRTNVGKYILGQMPGGRTEVWVSESHPNKTFVIDENVATNIVTDRGSAEKFGVICAVDLNTL